MRGTEAFAVISLLPGWLGIADGPLFALFQLSRVASSRLCCERTPNAVIFPTLTFFFSIAFTFFVATLASIKLSGWPTNAVGAGFSTLPAQSILNGKCCSYYFLVSFSVPLTTTCHVTMEIRTPVTCSAGATRPPHMCTLVAMIAVPPQISK